MKAFLLLLLFLTTVANAADSDGSQADVQSKLTAAADGETVTIPAGSFTWSSQVAISGKGVHLQGAGSGRVVARSATSVAVGTGAKTFTVNASGLDMTAGQTLRIERTGTPVSGGNPTGTRTYMIGTVTSYSGSTLVMNITSTGGSGTHTVWIVSSTAATTITHSVSGVLLALTEDASHSVEVSGLRFVTGSGNNDYVQTGAVAGGEPILIHDCYFESTANFDCIQVGPNRGIIYNCSFPAFPFSTAQLGIHHQSVGETTSWTTTNTMGMADPDGKSNLYVEDCDFHAWLNCTDHDDNSRSVYRHNVMNNAGFGTHGADTSNYGMRHYEVYQCEFVFNGFSDGTTFNLNWWFYLRGGTGVIASNIMPNISSGDYGDKGEVNCTVMNLGRNAGPNPCWNSGYPAPRQIGMGRVTGAAGNDSITYKGDLEPLYIYGNTGTYSVGFSDGYAQCGGSPHVTSDYVVAGRDFYNNQTAKPTYAFYTYPHPLRAGEAEPVPTIVNATTVNAGTVIKR